jgi:hypothetical protein
VLLSGELVFPTAISCAPPDQVDWKCELRAWKQRSIALISTAGEECGSLLSPNHLILTQ